MIQLQQTPSVGEKFGSSLQAGLSPVLNALISDKMQQMKQQRSIGGLEALGMPQAQQVSQLPPEIQKLVVSNYLAAAEKGGLEEELGKLGLGEEPQAPAEQSSVEAALSGLQPTGAPSVEKPVTQEAIPSTVAAPVAPRKKTLRELLTKPRLSAQDKMRIAQLKQQKDIAAKKMDMAERKEKREIQREADSESREVYKEINKEHKDTKDSDMRLGRMTQLVKKGDLTEPGFYGLLDTLSKGVMGFGLNAKYLMSPDSQEFEKLSKDYLKGAKAIFGSRVTEGEIKLFLETVPTLAQSKQGKERIIRNMKLFNEAKKVRKKSMDEIIERNGGERPKNLASLIDKASEAKLDAIAEKFKFGKPKSKTLTGGTIISKKEMKEIQRRQATPSVGNVFGAPKRAGVVERALPGLYQNPLQSLLKTLGL